MSRQGRTGKKGRETAVLTEENTGQRRRYRAYLLAVAKRALLALYQQVPGGISNFYNAFHGFAVQALDWYLIDRELIAPFAQADFLPRRIC